MVQGGTNILPHCLYVSVDSSKQKGRWENIAEMETAPSEMVIPAPVPPS